MKTPLTLAALSCAILASCGTNADRYTAAPPAVTQSISIRFGSVEIREVSLPTYAAADEIHQQAEGGVLKSDTAILWADAPERAVALDLARNLTKLTGARVASEPWPFEAFPEARLEVRFEDLLPGSDGVLRASGQYFVGVEDGRERAGLFDLSVPFAADGGPAAIAAARGQIILDLAEFIARDGLR